MNEKTRYFNYFLHELKFKLVIVKSICETNNTDIHFNKKWASIDSLKFSL